MMANAQMAVSKQLKIGNSLNSKADYFDRYYSDCCPYCLQETTSLPCHKCGYVTGQDNDPPFLSIGTTLDERYRIAKVLGDGGFGITYLAWEENLQYPVAIKEYFYREAANRAADGLTLDVYPPPLQETFYHGLDRFMTEARLLAKFDKHPNIISPKNFFRANGTGYMVMEYVEGIAMNRYLEQFPENKISFKHALELLTPIMNALQAIHDNGLMHRDVTPANIYITEDNQVKLLDFGAARFFTGLRLDQDLSVLLKHGYSPEEQYRSKGKQGAWTDVYAMAATIYRSITGVVPHNALDRLDHDNLAPPSLYGIELSESQETAIMTALAVKSDDRFKTITEFSQALHDDGDANSNKQLIAHTHRPNLVKSSAEHSATANLGKTGSNFTQAFKNYNTAPLKTSNIRPREATARPGPVASKTTAISTNASKKAPQMAVTKLSAATNDPPLDKAANSRFDPDTTRPKRTKDPPKEKTQILESAESRTSKQLDTPKQQEAPKNLKPQQTQKHSKTSESQQAPKNSEISRQQEAPQHSKTSTQQKAQKAPEIPKQEAVQETKNFNNQQNIEKQQPQELKITLQQEPVVAAVSNNSATATTATTAAKSSIFPMLLLSTLLLATTNGAVMWYFTSKLQVPNQAAAVMSPTPAMPVMPKPPAASPSKPAIEPSSPARTINVTPSADGSVIITLDPSNVMKVTVASNKSNNNKSISESNIKKSQVVEPIPASTVASNANQPTVVKPEPVPTSATTASHSSVIPTKSSSVQTLPPVANSNNIPNITQPNIATYIPVNFVAPIASTAPKVPKKVNSGNARYMPNVTRMVALWAVNAKRFTNSKPAITKATAPTVLKKVAPVANAPKPVISKATAPTVPQKVTLAASQKAAPVTNAPKPAIAKATAPTVPQKVVLAVSQKAAPVTNAPKPAIAKTTAPAVPQKVAPVANAPKPAIAKAPATAKPKPTQTTANSFAKTQHPTTHSINATTLEMQGIFAYTKPVRLERLMSQQERMEYVQAIRTATTPEIRQQIRELTYTRLGQRARELGMFVVKPHNNVHPEHQEHLSERRETREMEPRERRLTHREPIIQELHWTIAYKEPIRLEKLMSKQERREYIRAINTARTPEIRQQIREFTYARLNHRAQQQGMLVITTQPTHREPQHRESLRPELMARSELIARPELMREANKHPIYNHSRSEMHAFFATPAHAAPHPIHPAHPIPHSSPVHPHLPPRH